MDLSNPAKKRHLGEDQLEEMVDEPSLKKRKIIDTKSEISEKFVPVNIDSDLKHLCSGYVRNHFNIENVNHNPIDISTILYKYLFYDWIWDYCNCIIDNCNISENKKKIKFFGDCDWSYAICKSGMYPNSGIYKIKLKIGEICKSCDFNCVGISMNINDTSCNLQGNVSGWADSNQFMGWPAKPSGHSKNAWTYNGILFSRSVLSEPDTNLFYSHGAKYISNNKYNKHGLPGLKSNDIITMTYESNKNQLILKKENDNKCNCKIINLPNNQPLYWFVGHDQESSNLSVTILTC